LKLLKEEEQRRAKEEAESLKAVHVKDVTEEEEEKREEARMQKMFSPRASSETKPSENKTYYDVKNTASQEEDDQEKREAARMAKMFSPQAPVASSKPATSSMIPALVSPRFNPNAKLGPVGLTTVQPFILTEGNKPTSVPAPAPLKLESQQVEEKDDEEKREAARMAKMFGGGGGGGGGGGNVSPRSKAAQSSSENAGLHDTNAQAAREAERFAKSMGLSPRKFDPKEEQKEKDRKAFEKKIQQLDASDPKAFSKAFLEDPELAAHLRDAKSVMAVEKLKGVDVPGHRF